MLKETLVARFFRVLSFILVIFAIFWAYFGFPETVAVHHQNNKAIGFLPKNSLFYYLTGLVLLNNLLLNIFAGVFQKLPNSSLKFPNASAWLQNRLELNQRITNWTKITQGLFNTFLALVVYALAMVNLTETKKTIDNYQWMLAIGGFVLLVILFWLPVRVLFGKPQGLDKY